MVKKIKVSKRFPGEQKANRKKRLIGGLLFFICIVVIALTFVFWWMVWGGGVWDGTRRLNIIVNTNPLYLLSFENQDRELTVVTIPLESYLPVTSGYGDYKAGSIFTLGNLDKKIGGGLLLSGTISNTFGLPIDGYIDLNGKKLAFSQIFTPQKLWEINTDKFTRRKGINTDLDPSTLNRFLVAVMNLRTDQIKIYNLDELSVTERYLLPDKTEIRKIDTNKLDKLMEDKFREYEIVEENVSVAIYNAGTKSGVAYGVARIISNIGGKVVVVGNADEKIKDECQIGGMPKDSATYKRLKYIFDCVEAEMPPTKKVSDIFLYIGEGYNR